MLVGPVFSREAVTAPRRAKFFASRGAYVAALLLLMLTAWLVLAGTQVVRNVGDMARFGAIVFQILAPLQLAVLVFFSALAAASAVALEKDRRTLVLLLLTRLTNSELVLGKLLASVLHVLVMLAAAFPLFMMLLVFGGVAVEQVARTFAVTLASILAAASIGSTLALWREKTFQTLALTALVLVFWLAAGEAIAAGVLGSGWLGLSAESWGTALSPWQAVVAATRPYVEADPALGRFGTPVNLFLALALGLAVLLNAVAIALVRVWNPSREARQPDEDPSRESIWGLEHDLPQEGASSEPDDAEPLTGGAPGGGGYAAIDGAAAYAGSPSLAVEERSLSRLVATAAQRRLETRPLGRAAEAAEPQPHRQVWDQPILWREVRTWAYGRKVIVIRLAYLLLFALVAGGLYLMVESPAGLSRSGAAMALVPLFVVSLMLINAQAVTSLTSERDAKALDLLLVTDLTPQEFVFGKLGGILYNTKEMLLLPALLCVYLWWVGEVSLENLFYLLGGLAVLVAFVAMLGLHAGMIYDNSRSAIATSLGTVFFLFIGVATCIRMMIAFSGSFQFQLLPFAALIFGGGVGLFVALGSRNPSTAIGISSVGLPFATFYAITSSLIEPPQTLGVFLIITLAYGFTTAAMLIPALYEFDVATGRTTLGDE